MSEATRSRLCSIAHNALTNAFGHAEAGRVLVEFDLGEHGLRLSVSDHGFGLRDDYVERGHGFANMWADAGRLFAELREQAAGRE